MEDRELEVVRYEMLLLEEAENLIERVEENIREALSTYHNCISAGMSPKEAFLQALSKLPTILLSRVSKPKLQQ
ncbi:MAG: hypothetical protein NZ954_00385 [Thermofilaceae archaeon]|nr:hypothetical protein [Thermofilaceae archaeon]MCX8180363.1 hypothetical protein [Thermofilaceae archaeon]MDW8003898.1 hypothetical protein [Thermofilaceae archaeon]